MCLQTRRKCLALSMEIHVEKGTDWKDRKNWYLGQNKAVKKQKSKTLELLVDV